MVPVFRMKGSCFQGQEYPIAGKREPIPGLRGIPAQEAAFRGVSRPIFDRSESGRVWHDQGKVPVCGTGFKASRRRVPIKSLSSGT